MSLESGSKAPEQSTAEKAGEMLSHLEKGEAVQLYNAMSKLGDDPTFVGRINFITKNAPFIEKFNKNKPAGMPGLAATKEAYGYKGTADQNAVFVKTYLEMKASGLEPVTKAPEVKEVKPDTETDPNMPKDGDGDLDDWLGFMPRGSEKLGINTAMPIDVDLSKKDPGERADALLRTVFDDLNDFKYMVESYPMALASAITTVNEGLRAQGKNPYKTLGETASAEVKGGDLVLNQKDGSHLQVPLFPDSAWNRVDIRKLTPFNDEDQRALAEATPPKNSLDFTDEEEFKFNDEVPAEDESTKS